MSYRSLELHKLGKYEKALAGGFKRAFRDAAKKAAARTVLALHAATEDAPPAWNEDYRGAVHTNRLNNGWRVDLSMTGTAVTLSTRNIARNNQGQQYAGFVEGGRKVGTKAPPIYDVPNAKFRGKDRYSKPSEFTLWVRDRLNVPLLDAFRFAWVIGQQIKCRGLNKRPISTRAMSGSPKLPNVGDNSTQSIPAMFRTEFFRAMEREMVKAGYG